MKTIFFTICDSYFQANRTNARNLDFQGFMNSFKKFHPDIEMKVFDEHDMAKHGVNFYNAKATFGELLSREYDLVVNIDADTYIFDRLDEILQADYDVACPCAFNKTYNVVALKVMSGLNGGGNPQYLVKEDEYLQGGLIASPSKQFWKHYKYATDKDYLKFHCFENDTLNICAYTYPYKVKILDGASDFNSPLKTSCYGSSTLGRESNIIVQGDKLYCDGKPVKCYHFGHGSAKKNFQDIFPQSTHSFIQSIIS